MRKAALMVDLFIAVFAPVISVAFAIYGELPIAAFLMALGTNFELGLHAQAIKYEIDKMKGGEDE